MFNRTIDFIILAQTRRQQEEAAELTRLGPDEFERKREKRQREQKVSLEAVEKEERRHEMEKFFALVTLIRSKIKSIDGGRDDLWRISSQAMVSVSDDEVADLSARIEMISARTNKNAEEIRCYLKGLSEGNVELSKKFKDTACMRIRTIQADALVRKFTTSIGGFEATENSIQLKSRDLLVRRFQIVEPGIPSEDVIQALADNENSLVARNVFALAGEGTPEELERKLEHFRAQQRSMQRLEKSILTLNRMFLDMQNLVLAQDEQLNHVQTYVERTVEFQKLADLEKAIELQKNIRKIRCSLV